MYVPCILAFFFFFEALTSSVLDWRRTSVVTYVEALYILFPYQTSQHGGWGVVSMLTADGLMEPKDQA